MSLAEQYCWYCNEHLEKCTCKKLAPSPLSGEEIKPFDSAGDLPDMEAFGNMDIHKAARLYMQLPSHRQIEIWRKVGYFKPYNYGRNMSENNKMFFEWVKSFALTGFLQVMLSIEQNVQASVATEVDSSTSSDQQNNSSIQDDLQAYKVLYENTKAELENLQRNNSGEQQQVTGDDLNELMPETKEALAKLAEKHNKQQRNLDKVELQMSDQTLTIAKLQAGELYWKQRCLLVEECYQKLNLSEEHKKQYAEWQQVKNQEVEPGDL